MRGRRLFAYPDPHRVLSDVFCFFTHLFILQEIKSEYLIIISKIIIAGLVPFNFAVRDLKNRVISLVNKH